MAGNVYGYINLKKMQLIESGINLKWNKDCWSGINDIIIALYFQETN